MIDLKLSRQEKKKMMPTSVGYGKHDGPDYPYGFCINLEKDQIEKLKLDGMEVGDEVAIQSIGKIVASRVSEREGEGRHESMEIQIQQISIKSLEKTKADIRKETAKRVFEEM